MHLQQTKAGSRSTGGPQYFFHSLSDHVKEFLRKRGACPVVLQTPYGVARSPFMAVDRDHKLAKDGKVVAGQVGHDRIQAGTSERSIGEEIRYWYGLKPGREFERIDVDISIDDKGHFILIPTAVKMRETKRLMPLEKIPFPLSFHADHQSKLWREQIEIKRQESASDVRLAATMLNELVQDHLVKQVRSIHEADLLRAGSALSILGMKLSAYLVEGYDCLNSHFQFNALPIYPCPVEIKKRSSGFNYQITKYKELPRAVVLCMRHDLINPPPQIDVVEVPTLAKYLSQ